MEKDVFSNQWHQCKNKIKEKWSKLTDEDLSRINGKKDQLLKTLEQKYGWERAKADQEVRNFEQTIINKQGSKLESCSSCEPGYKGQYEEEEEEGEEKGRKRKIG